MTLTRLASLALVALVVAPACELEPVELGRRSGDASEPDDDAGTLCRCRIQSCRIAADCSAIGDACGADGFCTGALAACTTTSECTDLNPNAVCAASATSTDACTP